ncbi:hypothetical protein GOV11_00150 [Candidatus Woesearchaeota archaeon]|nr:hypothetical protein [Candidatus Woesearchaeota archaeon]
MKRRGELSMEVIIIAAIALLVLVILAVLVLRAGGNVAKECSNVGGMCESFCDSSTHITTPNSCPDDLKCCVPLDDDEFY